MNFQIQYTTEYMKVETDNSNYPSLQCATQKWEKLTTISRVPWPRWLQKREGRFGKLQSKKITFPSSGIKTEVLWHNSLHLRNILREQKLQLLPEKVVQSHENQNPVLFADSLKLTNRDVSQRVKYWILQDYTEVFWKERKDRACFKCLLPSQRCLIIAFFQWIFATPENF